MIGSGGVYAYTDEPLADENAIVVGRKGTAGRVIFPQRPSWPSDTTFFVEPDTSSISPAFLALYLQHANLGSDSTKTTMPSLQAQQLTELQVNLPDLQEQRRIARILSTIQAASNSVRAVLERQHGFSNALENYLFSPSTCGDWPMQPLGEVTTQRQYGLSVRGAPIGDLPILRMTNLLRGVVNYDNLQFVDSDSVNVKQYLLRQGDILFNRTNSPELVGRVGIVEQSTPSVFASYLIRLICDTSVIRPEFLNAFLNWEPTQVRLRGMATRGVSQANISASTLATLNTPTPPLDVQLDIVRAWRASRRVVDASFAETRALSGVFRTVLRQLAGGLAS